MNDTTAAPDLRTRPHPRPVANLLGFCAYAINRFLHDDGQQRAAALTFTSLLAMVPLLAVSFAIFAAFPAYESLKGRVQSFLFEQFVPSVGAEVQGYLEQFTAQTGQLTAVGIVFLAVSAVMLLMTISSTFNRIWKVKQTRGVISRLLVFWAVLTLTPMLFGASSSRRKSAMNDSVGACSVGASVRRSGGAMITPCAGRSPLVCRIHVSSSSHLQKRPARRRRACPWPCSRGLHQLEARCGV